uniref:Phosphoribosyltransferase n=1 Tax=uncultured Planctomycetota bacterium TaxID=120965 RepID=H5SIJ2_9BACT|nr:phosphoribosyltransferase [uncultured Planctomycetota bacterium]
MKRLGRYEGVLRDAVLQIKHAAYEGLAVALGRFLGYLLTHTEVPFDVIVPVPLHWWRQWRRGYNQAEALAEGIGEITGKRVLSKVLLRIRPTSSQTWQSPTERQPNIKGAFRAQFRGHSVPRSVLLVDDVMTTGSTLTEAARTLRNAGVREIHVAILARTE